MTASPRRLHAGCLCCIEQSVAPVTRRNFIAGGIAALGVGTASASKPATAQAPARRRIDMPV